MTTGRFNWVVFLLIALTTGCTEMAKTRRILNEVGPARVREEVIAACRHGFNVPDGLKIPESAWPSSVRAFQPYALWAEPDGAYVLIDSDAAGERGLYFPRLVSDKDPVCGPTLNHVKLAEGVYWYERKRA